MFSSKHCLCTFVYTKRSLAGDFELYNKKLRG